MSGIAICVGLGASVRGGAGAPPPALSVTGTADGEIEIDAGTGALTISITSPAYYAGTYTTDVSGNALGAAQMSAGPQCLVAPKIRVTNDADASATPSGGDTVGLGAADVEGHPGLWVYDTANGIPSITYRWQADTSGDAAFTDIAGATATSYVITQAEQGDDLRLVETAADAGGSRDAISNGLSIAPTSAASSFVFTDRGDSGLTGAQTAGPFAVAGLGFGAEAPGREIWAVIAVPGQNAQNTPVTSVTIGGIPATKLAGTPGTATYGAIEIWKAPVPSGATGTVAVSTSEVAYGAAVAVYRAMGKRLSGTAASGGSAAAAAAVSANIVTSAGETVLTGAWHFNGNGLSFTGVTADFAPYDFRTGDFFAVGTHAVSAGEAPRSVSATAPASATVFNILSATLEDDT